MTYRIPENTKPATDEEIAKLRRSLALFRHPNITNALIEKLIKRIECQGAELADRGRTIRNLTEDNVELAEQETAR